MIGKRLDKTYDIIGKLGEGGMGVVYEAKHASTGRRVAIKVILGEFKPDETLIARFQREARAAGSIDSRHIAQVLDAGSDPETGSPYLVMELLRGRDVDTLMKKMGALRPTLALRIVAQALAGLERAHGAKVIHRDIKPANLYIAEGEGNERIVKLVDFGVAKVKDDVTASREYSLTQTSSLLGSPLYMSPEQARTSKTVDGRADIWSLGTVLYQLLAGEAPHHLASSLTELLLAICTEPAPPIQDRAPWIPPEIAAIVMRSLEIDVAKRYPNTSAMLADVEAIVPDWQRLDESMITPMADTERTVVAKRAEPPPLLHVSTGPSGSKTISEMHVPIAGAASYGGGAKTAVFEESGAGARAISAPGTSVTTHESTRDAADREQGGKKRSILPIAIGGAVAAVFAVTFLLSTREPAKVPGLTPLPSPIETPIIAPPTIQPPSMDSIPSAVPSLVPSAAPSAKSASAPAKPSAKPSSGVAPALSPAPAPAPKPAPKPAPAPSSSISRDFN